MSAVCPKGHESEWEDWCSVCGERLAGADAASRAPAPAQPAATSSAKPPDGPACTNCGEPSHPDDVFCENCGYDFASGTLPVVVEAPPAPAEQSDPGSAPAVTTPLIVTVTVDADFFAATTAGVELALPDPVPDASEVTLTASRNLVGRHSESRGILPEIDVEALTQDPGVSSRHLMFERTNSGIWTFTDLGSTNGTYLSAEASADAIAPGNALPVADAMSLWLGAWTRLDLSIPDDDQTEDAAIEADETTPVS